MVIRVSGSRSATTRCNPSQSRPLIGHRRYHGRAGGSTGGSTHRAGRSVRPVLRRSPTSRARTHIHRTPGEGGLLLRAHLPPAHALSVREGGCVHRRAAMARIYLRGRGLGERPGRTQSSVRGQRRRLLQRSRPGPERAHQGAAQLRHQAVVPAGALVPLRALPRTGAGSTGRHQGVAGFLREEPGPFAALARFLDRAGYFRRIDRFGYPALNDFQAELVLCLHREENRIAEDNDQIDLERSMFITNPDMWKQVYGQDQMVEEGPGVVIKMPTTEEEFEEMVQEWMEDGYVPGVG